MSVLEQKCIKLKVQSVWYDTVDQPVVPIIVTNECNEDVVIDLVIKSIDGRKLHSEKMKLKPSAKKSLDITLSYYGDAIVTGVGKLEKSAKSIQLDEYKIKL